MAKHGTKYQMGEFRRKAPHPAGWVLNGGGKRSAAGLFLKKRTDFC
jgi:hypothetical protein